MTLLKTEPAILLGLVNAAIVLGVSFGLKIDMEQKAAIIAFAGAVITIVTRQVVTSPATAERLKAASAVPANDEVTKP